MYIYIYIYIYIYVDVYLYKREGTTSVDERPVWCLIDAPIATCGHARHFFIDRL